MREEDNNLNNEKLIIKLPTILETYIVINKINKFYENYRDRSRKDQREVFYRCDKGVCQASEQVLQAGDRGSGR